MAYSVDWYIHNRILNVRFIDYIDDNDMAGVNAEVIDHLDGLQNKAHLVVDLRGLKKYPTNVRHIKDFTEYLRHPNMGFVIALGIDNPLMRFFATVIPQVVGIDFRSAKEMDEALAILRRVDTTLTEVAGD